MEQILEWLKANKLLSAMTGLSLVLATGLVLVVTKPEPEPEEVFPLVEMAEQVQEDSEQGEGRVKPSEESQSLVTIDLKGAVKKPGIYSLPEGSRVADALVLAGGLTEEADSKSINLAQKLKDEAIIYVASQGEEISLVSPVGDAGASQSADSGKVSLNLADASQLQTIPGIGAKKAQDIIAYREANGGFQSVDDLGKVSGIGEKTLEKIRDYVTVE